MTFADQFTVSEASRGHITRSSRPRDFCISTLVVQTEVSIEKDTLEQAYSQQMLMHSLYERFSKESCVSLKGIHTLSPNYLHLVRKL